MSFLLFEAGGTRHALAAEMVMSVQRMPATLTRVPHAPLALVGLAGVGGRVVPVVSAGRLLGTPAADRPTRLILLALDPPVGLAVDSVANSRAAANSSAAADPIDVAALLRLALPARARPAAQAPAAPAPMAPAAAVRVLMTFDLAGQAYALPLETVTEALTIATDRLVSVPGGDATGCGAVAYRGTVLPLVLARGLLGLPAAPAAKLAVLVVRIATARRVGLVVDRFGGVLRLAEAAIGPVPPVLDRGDGEARIESLGRLAGGKLLSILAPARLFGAARLAHILDGAATDEDLAVDEAVAEGERFVVFRLGTEEYGLPVAAVSEIARVPDRLAKLPRAPEFLTGVMNLRGVPVALVDLAARFGVAAGGGRRRAVVTEIAGNQVGFIVDAVTGIVAPPASAVGAAPALGAAPDRSFDRVAALPDGRLLLLVDPAGLLERAEAELLRGGMPCP